VELSPATGFRFHQDAPAQAPTGSSDSKKTECMDVSEGWLARIETELVFDEGIKYQPYKDSLGNWTIGAGYYIGRSLENLLITRDVALLMAKERTLESVAAAKRIFSEEIFCSWEEPRQRAIVNLIYNMGEGNDTHGFRSFKKMIAAAKLGDWDTVAWELKNSLWATQVDPSQVENKGRDDRIAHMLRFGEDSADYP